MVMFLSEKVTEAPLERNCIVNVLLPAVNVNEYAEEPLSL